MAQFSNQLRNALLGTNDISVIMSGVAPNNGAGTGSMFIFIYNGTVPATADTALDMSGTHTQLGKISSNAGGSTGTSFGAVSGGVIPKNSSETWSTGAMTFSGANSGTSTLVAQFFRICYNTDNGQGAGGGSTPRIQGTIGATGTGVFDMYLTSASLTAGNNFTLTSFQINAGNL